MMSSHRKRKVNLTETPYRLFVCKCVRNAFLCGVDKVTGHSFEHRRHWLEERLMLLSTVFTIDICGYAVTNTQSQLVLHVNQQKAKLLSNKSVASRWHKLHKGTLLTHKFTQGKPLDKSDRSAVKAILNMYRKRLSDVSWFMRELRGPIARQANMEDECTGHFWESRVKSQAIHDKYQLAACIDSLGLKPIRCINDKIAPPHLHCRIKAKLNELKREGAGNMSAL
jgi:hypothetical protein